MESLEILGVRVDKVSYKDLLEQVDAFVASGQPHQIVTVNPEMILAACDDGAFQQVLNRSELNVADGVGVTLAARWLGQPLPERVTGSDGIYRLAAHCAARGYRPFLLGAAPGVAETAGQRLVERYPGLEVAGTYAGSPWLEEEDSIIARVRAVSPDLLLVAYGVPAEELWIARNRERLGVPVMVGVGGSFDFVAGVTQRAPPWMRRMGLEWLHRLAREPWRWRRQSVLPRYVALVLKQRIQDR
ncbi:MAG: WecB/TagA/CpsF family glycosyltransferase [Anaerolineae bacterium]|jgi:N-acetylglucosaminyldiphosphoundecaprenol N-acetyl-beta-D-mannosaminyltransferase